MPSLTITFTTEQKDRIAAAFQEALALDDPATAANIKQYIVRDLIQVVRNAERAIAKRDFDSGASDVDFS